MLGPGSGASLWGAPGQLRWAEMKTVPADINGDGKDDLRSFQPNANGNLEI